MKEYSDFIINKINSMSDDEFENILNESGLQNCPLSKINEQQKTEKECFVIGVDTIN